jgi:hypothetical protein
MINYNYESWLAEADDANAALANQPPVTQPPVPVGQMGVDTNQDGQQKSPPQNNAEAPELPDPDIKGKKEAKDFDSWKHEFLKLAVHSDVGKLLDMIGLIRHIPGLESSQRKFVEDNLQILLYRQEDNINKSCKEIRRQIKDGIDKTNPGSSIMQIMTGVLETQPVVSEILLKLSGMYGSKGEFHRKYICALLGAIQQGGSGEKADLLFCGDNYTVNLSTRITGQFGEIKLGKWFLKESDPEKYLAPAELDRLENGAPEEKQVLRRRIMVDSISEKFKNRSFVIHVVNVDGTIVSIGWDLGESLSAAYSDGNIVVRAKANDEKDAIIAENGKILPLLDLEILYIMETGELDENGDIQMREVPFLERKGGYLYLVSDLSTLKKAAPGLSGMFFREIPYSGNPSDLTSIKQCVASLAEILNRRCFK